MRKDTQQEQMNKSRAEYISRINRVIDYIEKNITNTITLDELADVACFSKSIFTGSSVQ